MDSYIASYHDTSTLYKLMPIFWDFTQTCWPTSVPFSSIW